MSLEILAEHRSISLETLENAGVYWVDDDENYPVRIPYYSKYGTWYERKMFYPGRTPQGKQQKVLSPTGGLPHMYNPLRLGPNADLVFFTEGEYDTLAVIDAGFAAIGNQGAGTWNATWCRLFTGATVVIAYDGDSAGLQASNKLKGQFAELGAVVHILRPDEGYDLNDYHREGILDSVLEAFIDDNDLHDAYSRSMDAHNDGRE